MLVITEIYKLANATLHLKIIKPKKWKNYFLAYKDTPTFLKLRISEVGYAILQSSSRRVHTFDKDKDKTKDKEKDKEEDKDILGDLVIYWLS